MALGEKPKTQFGHEHRFIFLRQDKESTKRWGDRILGWTYFDVFFCEGCLEYHRVKVLETEPARDAFGEVTTWRKA